MLAAVRRVTVLTAVVIVVATGAFVIGTGLRPAAANPGGSRSGFGGPLPDVRAAVELLQREPLSFLVTERVVTQVVTEANNGNVVLGYGNGLLVGKVELLFGVDLADLDLAQAAVDGDTIRIRIPAPQLLRYVPDLATLRYVEKKSALLVIVDRARGEDLFQSCLDQLQSAAAAFAEENGLAPTRAELVARLNRYAPTLAARVGAHVVCE